MGSFGEKLKREREMRAITLEEIAEATKIGTRSLRALEEEHFDQLPGGIFNKGFVRAYAKFLGIDEEQAVADYLAATDEPGSSTTTQMQALADEAERQREAKEAAAGTGGTGAMLAVIIIGVVIAGIGFGGYKAYRYKKDQQDNATAMAAAPRRQAPPPVTMQPAATDPAATPADPNAATASGTTPGGTTPGATPATTPAATNPASTPAPSTSNATPAPASSTSAANSKNPAPSASNDKPPAQPYPVMVTLKARDKAWIRANIDGKVQTIDMDPGTEKRELSLHANDKITLLIGNAAGVDLVANGKSAGPLGSAHQTVTLFITPQGIQK